MKLRVILGGVALCAAMGGAWAKLPALPPADPAKAEEAKLKAAEAARKDAELLGKYQDRAVANYQQSKLKPVAPATMAAKSGRRPDAK